VTPGNSTKHLTPIARMVSPCSR